MLSQNIKYDMAKTKSKTLITLILLAIITLFIVYPSACMEATTKSLYIWLINVVPALFPFFILTRIIISLNQSSIPVLDKFTNKCFHAPKSGLIYFLSLISGYPVGAKMISNYYEGKAIDKLTAQKMFSFCSTSGPMFIVGSIGIGVFGSAKVGYVLLLGHIAGSFLNGLLYRGVKASLEKASPYPSTTTLNEMVYDSMISILMVGGYIVFAGMLINALEISNILPSVVDFVSAIFKCNTSSVNAIICGIIEVTSGLVRLGAANISLLSKIVISSGLIAFSGICIILQSKAFLIKLNIKTKTILKQKITQAILTIIITFLIAILVF